MPAAVRILPHYTVAERNKWEDQWELIEGIPFAMSPAPIPQHQRVSFLLAQEFEIQFRSKCKVCKVYQAIDWKISEDTVFIPDLLVTCKPVGKKNLETAPELIAEILSPSTALKDRNSKFVWYQQQKVQYYLLINTDAELVEIFELVDGVFAPIGHSGTFTFKFSEGCQASVDFSLIWD
jgi:Uma2 family endonuclease